MKCAFSQVLLSVLCFKHKQSDKKKNHHIHVIIIGLKSISGGSSWMLHFFMGPLKITRLDIFRA